MSNDNKWDEDAMMTAEISALDGQYMLALILAVVRAERFCEGVLLSFLENGAILKWLERLKSIDEGRKEE